VAVDGRVVDGKEEMRNPTTEAILPTRRISSGSGVFGVVAFLSASCGSITRSSSGIVYSRFLSAIRSAYSASFGGEFSYAEINYHDVCGVDRYSGGSDGGVDWAGLPGGGFDDEAIEESAGGRADVVAALRVPLDAEDEVSVRMVRILAAFDSFDDGVLRATSRDPEAIAGNPDGLMMR
jgi:hypothetical protein